MGALRHEDDWVVNATSGRVQEFYSALGVELPGSSTGNVSVRCFTNPHGHNHGDRDASCSVDLIAGKWKCFGCDQAGGPYSAAVALGFTPERARELARSYGLFLERGDSTTKRPRLPSDTQFRRWRERLQASPLIVERLRELKGWTPQALRACRVGWDGERLVFQVREPRPKVRGLRTVGAARYLPGGKPKMVSVPGSRRSLFPPPEVMLRSEPVYLVEGEPAAVSVRSCGLQAVAVPGVSSWRFDWAGRFAGFRVVVLPDCDEQGRGLAERVSGMIPKARVVDLDPSVEDGSDVGDWVAEGGVRVMRRVLERVAA